MTFEQLAVCRQLLAQFGRLIEPARWDEHVAEVHLNLGRKRVGSLRNAQLLERLLDSAERPEKEKGEVIVRHRAARVELDRSAEAPFRLIPLRVTRVGHPQRLVRFSQQRVQLDALLRGGSHFAY